MTAPRPPYPPVGEFTFPTPGQRTWKAPEASYFDECTADSTTDAEHACRVGVRKVNGRVYGCDCACHQVERERLAAR